MITCFHLYLLYMTVADHCSVFTPLNQYFPYASFIRFSYQFNQLCFPVCNSIFLLTDLKTIILGSGLCYNSRNCTQTTVI